MLESIPGTTLNIVPKRKWKLASELHSFDMLVGECHETLRLKTVTLDANSDQVFLDTDFGRIIKDGDEDVAVMDGTYFTPDSGSYIVTFYQDALDYAVKHKTSLYAVFNSIPVHIGSHMDINSVFESYDDNSKAIRKKQMESAANW